MIMSNLNLAIVCLFLFTKFEYQSFDTIDALVVIFTTVTAGIICMKRMLLFVVIIAPAV